ncbi:hypothetical protein AB0L41_43330 [Amycolatopsis mediterranei]
MSSARTPDDLAVAVDDEADAFSGMEGLADGSAGVLTLSLTGMGR